MDGNGQRLKSLIASISLGLGAVFGVWGLYWSLNGNPAGTPRLLIGVVFLLLYLLTRGGQAKNRQNREVTKLLNIAGILLILLGAFLRVGTSIRWGALVPAVAGVLCLLGNIGYKANLDKMKKQNDEKETNKW